MRLNKSRHIATRIKQAGSLTAASLLVTILLAPAAYAADVSYAVTPTSLDVKPDSNVTVTVSIKTTVPLAGGSLHAEIANGSYVSDSVRSLDSTNLTFVYYHPAQNDLVFICKNNLCAPGTYEIATLEFKAGQSGAMNINFTPKETADPDLKLIPADGATGSYKITPTAAPAKDTATGKDKNGDTGKSGSYTIPVDDGNGNMVPQKITSGDFQNRYMQARNQDDETAADTNGTGKSFWTFQNILIAVVGAAVVVGLLLLFVLRYIGRTPKGPGPFGPSGPAGPSTPGGPSNIVVG